MHSLISSRTGKLLAVAALIAAIWLVASGTLRSLTDGWKTVTNDAGVTFSYPERVSRTHIGPVDWPPTVSVSEGSLTCPAQTQIGDRAYCITAVAQGAAGTVYTTYTYTTLIGSGKIITIVVALKQVQCANYNEPQQAECRQEQGEYDLDGIIDSIVRTI